MPTIVPIGGSKLGNFLHFQRDPLDFLQSVRDKGDVISLSHGARPAYIVNSPEFIREILVTKDNSFRKGRSSTILGRTAGCGLLTSEGTLHEQQRRMMLPAFHKPRLLEYADTVVECANEQVRAWQDCTERWLSREMMDLTLEIITRTMFATSLGEEAGRVAKAIDDSIVIHAKQLMSPVLWPSWLPTRTHFVHQGALRILNRAVHDLITAAKQTPREHRHDLLSMLLQARDEAGQPLTDQEIRDQLITILIAGHETTANALTWMWYLLALHPEVEAKFVAELDDVLGARLPTFADLPQLVYTQQIFQEALRLYPPAWMILREANEAVEVCGHLLPKNASLIICPYTVHRNPVYFDHADEFVPERFAGEAMKEWPRFAYFPFGGGSRACIGSHFAQLEAVLVLATIGRQFRMRLPANHHPIRPEPLVSLRVAKGLRMRVERRSL